MVHHDDFGFVLMYLLFPFPKQMQANLAEEILT